MNSTESWNADGVRSGMVADPSSLPVMTYLVPLCSCLPPVWPASQNCCMPVVPSGGDAPIVFREERYQVSSETVQQTEEVVLNSSSSLGCTPSNCVSGSQECSSGINSSDEVAACTTPQDAFEDSGIGVYGSDGCWYPVKMPPQDSSLLYGFDHSTPVKSLERLEAGGSSRRKMPERSTEISVQKKSFYNYFHRVDLPSETLGRPLLLQSFRSSCEPCVEDAWIHHKNLLFRNLQDVWTLRACPKFKYDINWFTYRDFAKVRFYCKICKDGWTSMHGLVTFYFRWNRKLMEGEVLYLISGQKCASCSLGHFEMPLWYPEEAQKVITNLYYKICGDIYGLKTPKFIRTRRQGAPVTSHNANLCQGCFNGICSIGLRNSK